MSVNETLNNKKCLDNHNYLQQNLYGKVCFLNF